MRRKVSHVGVPHDRYVQWFLPISQEIFRVLKGSGKFILNFKEDTTEVNERSTYVFELVLALKSQGWQ
jgi:site-specific DNA-methyltransferase (adenine-specific)/site-specific DNA-methyltransferase (cytosine-N4-specific)